MDTADTATITTKELIASGTDAVQVVTASGFAQFGRVTDLWSKERVAQKGKNAGQLVPAKVTGQEIRFHAECYGELKARLTQEVKDKTLSSKDKKAILGAALRGQEAEAANIAAMATIRHAERIGGVAQKAVVKGGKLVLEYQLPESNSGRATPEELRLRAENAQLQERLARMEASLAKLAGLQA